MRKLIMLLIVAIVFVFGVRQYQAYRIQRNNEIRIDSVDKLTGSWETDIASELHEFVFYTDGKAEIVIYDHGQLHTENASYTVNFDSSPATIVFFRPEKRMRFVFQVDIDELLCGTVSISNDVTPLGPSSIYPVFRLTKI